MTARGAATNTPDYSHLGVVHVPPDVWEQHRDVLQARDVGAMFRLARQWAGASQQRLAAATGIPQSRVCALMNDRSGPVARIEVLQRIADGLDLPDAARMDLGLAPRQRSETVPTTADEIRAPQPSTAPRDQVTMEEDPVAGRIPPPADVQEAGEDATDRRQALQLGASTLLTAALGCLGDEPFDRLAFAVEAQRCDETTVAHLEALTAELFTREELVPADVLREELARQVDLLARLIPTGATQSLRTRLAIAAAEAAALAGWVAYDLGNPARATSYWQAGLKAGHFAGDGPSTALTMAYASYHLCEDGNHAHARQLLDEAGRHLHATEHTAALAWVTARTAEEHAHLGLPTAGPMLDRAATLLDTNDGHLGRAWTHFFDQARLGAMTIAVHARLDLPDLDTAVTDVLHRARADAKTHAVILGDLATAQLTRGDLDQACDTAQQALRVTIGAHATLGRQRLTALIPTLNASDSPAAKDLAQQITAAA
jgi:transcriptional regulator with XRE-family HTH domain